MSDHAFENTYDLSNEQLQSLDEAEEEMLRNNLGKAEEILLAMLVEDEECIPVLNNLAHLYGRHFSDFEKAVEIYAEKEFSQFKKDLGELASAKLSPISLEMNKLMKDEKYLDSIISNGKERAINVADPVLSKIYEIIGFFRD